MIHEQYVSFETAKLLKEKGFDLPCEEYFTEDGKEEYDVSLFLRTNSQLPGNLYSQPSQSLVMRWLRENIHYYIQIILDSWVLGTNHGYYIAIRDINSNYEDISPETSDGVIFYNTYEEACEAAIQHCLKNLI